MKWSQQIESLRSERENVKATPSIESLPEFLKRYRYAVVIVAFGLMVLVTRVMGRHPESGRGAGAEGGGLAASRAANESLTAPSRGEAAGLGQGQYTVLYAPDDDLESADVKMIGLAKRRIDAALYSLTDKPLCNALAAAARRGVTVRVYRDGEQYAEEQRRGRSGECGVDLVDAGVAIRVKPIDAELMHLKSYVVDDGLLRTGSANTSFAGELKQDNDAVFLAKPEAVRKFDKEFSAMWARQSNVVLDTDGKSR